VRDIAYRVIWAQLFPDHPSIALFRKKHGAALEDLFPKILLLCKKAGLVKVGRVALDGYKIKANAALDDNRTVAHLREEVKGWLSEAETADREETRTGEGDGKRLPKPLAQKEERKSRVRKCLADLEAKAEQLEREREEKVENRTEQEETSGDLRGRNPKEAPVDPETLKANTTDPESRIMKSHKEGYVQAYNTQIVVNEDQIIVGAVVTQEANDPHQLLPCWKRPDTP